jgi:hypothetical protein
MIDLAPTDVPAGLVACHPELTSLLEGAGFARCGLVSGCLPAGLIAEVWTDDAGTVAVPGRWMGTPQVRLTTALHDGTVVMTLRRAGPRVDTRWAGSGLEIELVDASEGAQEIARHRERLRQRDLRPVEGEADALAVLRTTDTLMAAVARRQALVQRTVKIGATVTLSGLAALGCTLAVLTLDLTASWSLPLAVGLIGLGGLGVVLASLTPWLSRVAGEVADAWIRRVPPLRSPIRPEAAPDNPFAS